MSSAITSVSVDTDADGQVAVRWAVDGEPLAVDVAVGTSPDGIDHVHATTVVEGETSLALDGRRPGRVFVSVSPHGGGPAVIAADRRVPFEGVVNFRDLGGYPTREGGHVRWGRLFRADALHNLTASDLATYEGLGVRLVVDLRSDTERREMPNPIESRALPLAFRRDEGSDEPAPALVAASPEEGERVLADLYLNHVERSGARIGEILTAMADPDGLPAVFHCHAGKDRTGVIAALLLELLGVDRQVVLDDYELTSRYRSTEHHEGTFQRLVDLGMSRDAAAGVLMAPRWAMRDALEVVDAEHGGVEAYLLGPGEMALESIAALRRQLLSES